MLPDIRDYAALTAAFRWRIPEKFNIGAACCDVWAAREPERTAILELRADGTVVTTTYARLRERSNRLANALRTLGVRPGERVAILLPQAADVAVAHLAAYKLGAVALPLAAIFGADALGYRLADGGVKILITNAAGLAKTAAVQPAPPDLEHILCTDGAAPGALDFEKCLAQASPHFAPADTLADDPALMIYTSGTTGPAKGALHAHRVLLGHLPGVQFPHEFLPQPGDRLWTPADWAWAGGLLNILLPGLYFGVPVVAGPAQKFDPEAAFALMERMAVRNTFIPPTALRMLRAVEAPARRFKLNLRTLASGGEALGAATFQWGRDALGLSINEFYGQTECNLVLASCAAIGVSRAGSIGRAVPGHHVAVVDAEARAVAPGTPGEIAVRAPDPVMFLGYWNRPEATQAKFTDGWLMTGDQGVADAEGNIHFSGRDDDIITSAGYRIGPGEIEDCLARHPAVALAAAVGKPDPVRTEIVKAFIVLRPGIATTDALAAEISAFVRTRLSAHEYPREIAFVSELPLTTTGKVIRRELRERG